MKVYSILLTIEVAPDYQFDEPAMMAKCLTVVKQHFEVVKTAHHVFVQGAFTYVMILAESHAVVQTYPELNKIFLSLEFHEENEGRPVIKDRQMIKDLVEALGGEITQYEKMER